ncbi:unnamed protein product [Chrysoparadoxa australica]
MEEVQFLTRSLSMLSTTESVYRRGGSSNRAKALLQKSLSASIVRAEKKQLMATLPQTVIQRARAQTHTKPQTLNDLMRATIERGRPRTATSRLRGSASSLGLQQPQDAELPPQHPSHTPNQAMAAWEDSHKERAAAVAGGPEGSASNTGSIRSQGVSKRRPHSALCRSSCKPGSALSATSSSVAASRRSTSNLSMRSPVYRDEEVLHLLSELGTPAGRRSRPHSQPSLYGSEARLSSRCQAYDGAQEELGHGSNIPVRDMEGNCLHDGCGDLGVGMTGVGSRTMQTLMRQKQRLYKARGYSAKAREAAQLERRYRKGAPFKPRPRGNKPRPEPALFQPKHWVPVHSLRHTAPLRRRGELLGDKDERLLRTRIHVS